MSRIIEICQHIMNKYYDIHTHRPSLPQVFAIQNLYTDFGSAVSTNNYSMGLHPWYLENSDADFQMLQKNAAAPNVLAIGECGLDKVCKTNWELQLWVLIRQIALANDLRKPIIIHCVRAFEELIKLLDEYPPLMPVIIHGYNKSAEVASRLLARGFYLSFGAAILADNTKATQVLSSVPDNLFFLETDDATVSISDIYRHAAEIRKTDEETIILQVQRNFQNVFRK